MGKTAEDDPQLPDHLRCKRSDGRDWRCKKQVLEGKGVCENHFLSAAALRKKRKDQPLPDHLRCKRSDGRDWRCKRHVMEGKTMCEIHYVQGRLRQSRQTVPEALKFKRGEDKEKYGVAKNETLEALGSLENARKMGKNKKRKRKRGEEEVIQANGESIKGLKKMKTELIRSFLKREIERSTKRGKKSSSATAVGSNGSGEEKNKGVTRDLPYGLMAIPPPPSKIQSLDNAGSLTVKLGVSQPFSLVNRRFRSKNVQPPPIGALKALPLPTNAGKVKTDGKKKCHWCRKGVNRSLVQCLACKKRFFCSHCITERHINEEQVQATCPVCLDSCNCKICLTSQSKDLGSQENAKDQFGASKVQCLHYLLRLLFPILQKINQEQTTELEREAKLKGQNISEIDIKLAEIATKDESFCNYCRSPILDLHRSCPNCSYKLCLNCCWDSGAGTLPVGSETFVIKYPDKSVSSNCDGKNVIGTELIGSELLVCEKSGSAPFTYSEACIGRVSCPPMEFGGCDSSLLELRRLFPLKWMKELELSCHNVLPGHDSQDRLDDCLPCTVCTCMSRKAGENEELREASKRKESDDNFLLCSDGNGCHDELLIHFQRHWSKGQPVILRNVIEMASTLNWDPATLLCRYLERGSTGCGIDDRLPKVTNMPDWYEVEFNTKESFGRSHGVACKPVRHETLKMKAKFSSKLCQQLFAGHHAEVIRAFPLQEYTNPSSGLLNLATKVSEEIPNPRLSPHILITYGSADEAARGDLVTNLSCSSHDMVNVLVYSSNNKYSSEQLNHIKNMVQNGAGANGKEEIRVLENGAAGDHSEVIDEAGQRERLVGGTTGVASASCCSTANHEDKDANIRHGNVSPTKILGSDTDSDASMGCCGTSDSPHKITNQVSNSKSGGTINVAQEKSCADAQKNSSADAQEKSCADAQKKTCADRPFGAQWDIFRREDTPKLLEYMKQCSNEFCDVYGLSDQVIHPIFDKAFFLDAAHKMKLKEEFKIEPWTFKQSLGEAVVVPAGCPYQIRNMMSCVNVVMGFISPESAVHSIDVTEELQHLPVGHVAREDLLEVKKMSVHCISEAIKEIHTLS